LVCLLALAFATGNFAQSPGFAKNNTPVATLDGQPITEDDLAPPIAARCASRNTRSRKEG
jgi:hypothetical protein